MGWGYNFNGNLGIGNTTQQPNPVTVTVRQKDGTVFAWGFNPNGQIGDGTTTSRLTPFQVPVGAGNPDISAGYFHAFASKPIFSVPIGTSQSFYGHNLLLYCEKCNSNTSIPHMFVNFFTAIK